MENKAPVYTNAETNFSTLEKDLNEVKRPKGKIF